MHGNGSCSRPSIFESDKKYWLKELNSLPEPVGLSLRDKLFQGNSLIKVNHYTSSLDEQSLTCLKGPGRQVQARRRLLL